MNVYIDDNTISKNKIKLIWKFNDRPRLWTMSVMCVRVQVIIERKFIILYFVNLFAFVNSRDEFDLIVDRKQFALFTFIFT